MSSVLLNSARAGVRPIVATASRLTSIDALRGLVMIFMLLDHIRETWFLHVPVTDPVDAQTIMPALFFTRLTSTLCAPIFVALTGLSAFMYSQRHTLAETSGFLLKRGLFLVLLEFTLVNFSWRAELPPTVIYLQVIWAIGLCMVVMAALIHLSRRTILVLGIAIVCGHNLFDGFRLNPGDTFYLPWGFLHHRMVLDLFGIPVRVNYPLLPWIGVICLGWSIGPWFGELSAGTRQRRLVKLGLGMLAAFVVLRALNVYGDAPWFVVPGDGLRTVMSFLALTKYPPSLLFLLSTLGVGAILLACFEKWQDAPVSGRLAVLGGAPMFFYLFHLYCLRALYLAALAIFGANHGNLFGVSSLAYVWLWYACLIVVFYFPTAWFSGFKKRRKDIWVLKYL